MMQLENSFTALRYECIFWSFTRYHREWLLKTWRSQEFMRKCEEQPQSIFPSGHTSQFWWKTKPAALSIQLPSLQRWGARAWKPTAGGGGRPSGLPRARFALFPDLLPATLIDSPWNLPRSILRRFCALFLSFWRQMWLGCHYLLPLHICGLALVQGAWHSSRIWSLFQLQCLKECA